MAFDYINEAFKRLSILDEEMFDTSLDGINKLDNFMEQDIEDNSSVAVIDPNAETEEDLETSYVGKVITNCNVCHSHIFNNKDEIVIDPEDGSVNEDTACPYCGESEGFTIVGEIAPFQNDAATDLTSDSNASDSDVENASKEDLDELFDIELDARGFGGSGNNVHVGPGSIPLTSSLDTKKMSRASRRVVSETYESSNDETIIDSNNKETLVKNLNGYQVFTKSDVFVGTIDADDDEDAKSKWRRRKFEEGLTEDFKEVSIKTDDQHLEMTSDENGKVTVITEPVSTESVDTSAEMIAPLSDETESEIMSSNNIGVEDTDTEDSSSTETDSEEELDFDVEDVEEEGMDELGESYLKNVYENIESFKTTNVYTTPSKLIVEGIISFSSGAKKKTGFIFEAKDVNDRGQVRFAGFNKHLCESADALSLVGRIDNKKLFVESLKYNYSVGNNVVRGRVKRK